MRIRELLQESFDSYYELDVITPTSYMFTTEDGNEYNIQLKKAHNIQTEWGDVADIIDEPINGYDFNFYLVDESQGPMTRTSLDSTGGAGSSREAIKIFSTMMLLVKHSLTSQGMDFATFSGASGLGSLYQRMLDRHLTEDFEAFTKDQGNERSFLVIRKDALHS